MGLLPSIIFEICPAKFPPWCCPVINICPFREPKKGNSSEVLKTSFLAHTSEHDSDVKVYTDGSRSLEGVGCAVVSDHSVVEKRLPSVTSSFTAELLAILNALIFIFYSNLSRRSFVVFTDSMSSLLSLGKIFPSNPLIKEIKDWIVLISSRKKYTVKFCWVPSHVGICGNERADAAAKSASRRNVISNTKIPWQDFKNKIHTYKKRRWQDHWSTTGGNLKLKEIKQTVSASRATYYLNRRSAIVINRLRIGHTRLTHKYLMASGAERRVPLCPTCQVVLSVKHFLIECPAFRHQRRVFSLEGKSLIQVLEDDAPLGQVCRFLKNIRGLNLYFNFLQSERLHSSLA